MTIEALAYAVPDLVQTTEELARITGADPDFIRDKVGLGQRHVLGVDETGTDLSARACHNLFDDHPELPEQVDLLVCVTQTPDRRLPQNSARLAAALDLPQHVASFDISLGCSGYPYGLAIAEGFLAATGRSNALLVTCDPYTRIIDPTDKATNCVFGDAATVTWLRRDGPGGRIISSDFGTDGSAGNAITVPGGGAADPLVSVLEHGNRPDRDALRLHMNGRAVFNFVNSRVPKSIHACLDAADVPLDDVDWFALHQGSTYMLDAMTRRVGIPEEKVLKNMARFGNTVSSSVPLLLHDLQQAGDLKGRKVLVSGFGVGLSWATSLIQF
jgi:3-oxoacyl-[acyl-carrier-protein] synthase-3